MNSVGTRNWQKSARKAKVQQHGPRPTRNQHEVPKRLLAGEVARVGGTGWSFVEPFLAFLGEVGFFEILGADGEKFVRQMVEISLLISDRLLALLKLLGYTSGQLHEGFCRRGHADKQKPLHKNVLADAVEKLMADELSYILNESIKRLAAKGLWAESPGRLALDATDLETTARYKDRGAKTVTERKWSRKEKKVVEIEKTVHGFKFLAVYDVQLRMVVAAKVVKIQEHESQFTRDLLYLGGTNLGPGVIQVTLIDRGFPDGLTLWQVKHVDDVDFVVPAKDGIHVTTDARAFLNEKPDGQLVIADERLGQGPAHTGHSLPPELTEGSNSSG